MSARCPLCESVEHVEPSEIADWPWVCDAPSHGLHLFCGTGQEYLDNGERRKAHLAHVARVNEGRDVQPLPTSYRGEG